MSLHIVGRNDCPACRDLEEYLNKIGKGYSYFSIDTFPFLRTILIKSGFKTVPQVWDENGLYIGGYVETVAFFDDD